MAQRTSFNLTRAQILALDSLALAVGCINQSRVSEQPIANKTDLIRLIADNANDARLIEVLKTIKRSDQNAKTAK